VIQSLYLRSTFGIGDRTRLRKRTTEETQTLAVIGSRQMRLSTILFVILVTCTACGQTNKLDDLENKKTEIDKLVSVKKEALLIFVRTTAKENAQQVFGRNWPDNIVTTYNICKNSNDRVVFLAEFPFIESGDWNFEFRHYFADDGHLIATETRISYFSQGCEDKLIRLTETNLYDANFEVTLSSTAITDKDGKVMTDLDCLDSHSLSVDVRPTAKKALDLRRIRL
jgi:hypothetical protein